MKDYLGQDLAVDDEVVFVQKGYRNFLRGKIVKLTEKTCLIAHNKTNLGDTETKQFHDQVIKVPAIK